LRHPCRDSTAGAAIAIVVADNKVTKDTMDENMALELLWDFGRLQECSEVGSRLALQQYREGV
jgi:hypothetical protein